MATIRPPHVHLHQAVHVGLRSASQGKNACFQQSRQQSSGCSQHMLPVLRAYADTCCGSGWVERPTQACELLLLHCVWIQHCILSIPPSIRQDPPLNTRFILHQGNFLLRHHGQAGVQVASWAEYWVHQNLLAFPPALQADPGNVRSIYPLQLLQHEHK